ncbi:hypothetical protein ACVWWN_002454 [Mycobacterium sp. URHB0021]|jgi:hypothetical protein
MTTPESHRDVGADMPSDVDKRISVFDRFATAIACWVSKAWPRVAPGSRFMTTEG